MAQQINKQLITTGSTNYDKGVTPGNWYSFEVFYTGTETAIVTVYNGTEYDSGTTYQKAQFAGTTASMAILNDDTTKRSARIKATGNKLRFAVGAISNTGVVINCWEESHGRS